jgi:hypothetical protein
VEYPYSTDQAWRRLRAMRHQPPAHASRGQRRKVFAAAMKQCEQLLRAADAAGYEVKPLMLYYGLNQAGRAMLAAGADRGQRWEFSAHGLTCPNLDQSSRLTDLTVVDQGRVGGFQAIAALLSSPTLPESLPVSHVWSSIPEGAEVALQGTEETLAAVQISRWYGLEGHYLDEIHVSPWEPIAVVTGLPPELRRSEPGEIYDLLHKAYPTMERFAPVVVDDRIGVVLKKGPRPVGFQLRSANSEPLSPARGLDIIACGPLIYSDSTAVSNWVIPVLRGNSYPQHPLVAWWAILYTLSVIARYRPSVWTEALDIDASPDAPAIEYMLDEAHRAVINLVTAVMEDAAFGLTAGDMADRFASFERMESAGGHGRLPGDREPRDDRGGSASPWPSSSPPPS